MRETVLLYHFTDEKRLGGVKRALIPMGYRLKIVDRKDYLQPLGYLAGIKEIAPSEEVYEGEDFDREMMVMCGFGPGRIDTLILALRKAGVGRVDLKAVLTPTNMSWTSVHLYHEISLEHEMMSKMQEEQKKQN